MTTHEGEAREALTPEPELPAKVPENEGALTPDLPPRVVEAPDLWEGEAGDPAESRDESRGEADRTAEPKDPEPKDPKPQEAAD
ncbi:hypothetical protein ACWGHM_16215 [Streptomyces sp. NPDC054904]